MTRYTIEYLIDETLKSFANENGLEQNFYGDCHPDSIMELKNRMEKMGDKEIENAIDELRDHLKEWFLS